MRKRLAALVATLSLLALFASPAGHAHAASTTYTCTTTLNGVVIQTQVNVPASQVPALSVSYQTLAGLVSVSCTATP